MLWHATSHNMGEVLGDVQEEDTASHIWDRKVNYWQAIQKE
jgi:hypothetical protein